MEMGRLVRKGRGGATIPELMVKIKYLKKKSLGLKENIYFNFSQRLWVDCSPCSCYGPAGRGVKHDDDCSQIRKSQHDKYIFLNCK